MDQLETQVSDLRSFLGAAAAPQGQGRPDAAGDDVLSVASASVASAHDVAYSPGAPAPLRASSHHSSRSAPGDNSAPHHHYHHPGGPQSPLVDLRDGHGHAHSTSSSPGTLANSNAAKRRAADDEEDDGPARQQRSKRNRYISIACNECKRRKIKCNGQAPCQRCGHLNLQCLYAPNCCANFKDSDEFRHMTEQVRQLQEHVAALSSSIHSLRQERETSRLPPLQDRVLPPPTPSLSLAASSASRRPALPYRTPSFFNGPTSIAFTVDVAKDTLHKMGYSGAGDGGSSDEGAAQPEATPHASPLLATVPAESLAQSPADPIWEFDEAEIMRLLQVYREEVDVMYPVVSIGPVMEHIKYMTAWMDTARRTGVPPPGAAQILADPKTMLLKIVICCALVVAEHGNSPKAVRLYDSIQPTVDKMLMSSPANVTDLSFLALCAGYRYLSNDEILAWRLIGQVARLCFELGLHRREGLQNIADPQTRRDALHTFWSAYVLDRRWSFSTGLPFVCHDDKIDPKLPSPEGYPFLVAMIGYSRLSAKIWGLVDYFEPAVIRELKPRDFEKLDREITAWYETVPEEIKSGPVDSDKMFLPSGSYDLQRSRIWTRLRLNQVRIWLYTPVLHSATSIAENAHLAHKVVGLAMHTIRLLAHINNKTDMYRRLQVFFHQFLTSSIAVLFLASTHAPLQFSAGCRDDFYMALDLVKEMSARSWVSHRLWRTIRSLRAYAPKLGLEDYPARLAGGSPFGSARSPGLAGPFSGGPAAMASPPPVFTPGGHPMQLDDQSNGVRLQSEMLRIYEGYTAAAGGVGCMGSPAAADMGYGAGPALAGMNRGGGGGGGQGDGGVYHHVKDMF